MIASGHVPPTNTKCENVGGSRRHETFGRRRGGERDNRPTVFRRARCARYETRSLGKETDATGRVTTVCSRGNNAAKCFGSAN